MEAEQRQGRIKILIWSVFGIHPAPKKSREGLGWIAGKNRSLESTSGAGVTVPGIVPKITWRWHLGTWVNGERGSAGL